MASSSKSIGFEVLDAIWNKNSDLLKQEKSWFYANQKHFMFYYIRSFSFEKKMNFYLNTNTKKKSLMIFIINYISSPHSNRTKSLTFNWFSLRNISTVFFLSSVCIHFWYNNRSSSVPICFFSFKPIVFERVATICWASNRPNCFVYKIEKMKKRPWTFSLVLVRQYYWLNYVFFSIRD